MKKQWIIISIVGVILAYWTGYDLMHSKSTIIKEKSSKVFDTTQYVNRKQELMLKDYDSAFAVVTRETTIIYSLRGWTVTLLALWLSVFLSRKDKGKAFMYLTGLFIILIFYFFEISERSVILSLIQDLRSLENIFNIRDKSEFNTAVINYQFRDIKDEKQSLFNYNVLKAIEDPKVYCWSMFLYVLYFFAIRKSKDQNKPQTQ